VIYKDKYILFQISIYQYLIKMNNRVRYLIYMIRHKCIKNLL